jgi:hypothetical protein
MDARAKAAMEKVASNFDTKIACCGILFSDFVKTNEENALNAAFEVWLVLKM